MQVTPVPLLNGLERMIILGCDVTSFSRYMLHISEETVASIYNSEG
jgi:hypothetical protein